MFWDEDVKIQFSMCYFFHGQPEKIRIHTINETLLGELYKYYTAPKIEISGFINRSTGILYIFPGSETPGPPSTYLLVGTVQMWKNNGVNQSTKAT